MASLTSMPIGKIPNVLEGLRPKLAEAAMSVYSGWQQIDGIDPELGEGGICQDIASAMTNVLGEHGIEHSFCIHAAVGENHVFVVALVSGEGIYEIDIPPSVYEIGSGYVWKKREDIIIVADDVCISRLGDDMNPDDFEEAYAMM